jgi:hypothetical protein
VGKAGGGDFVDGVCLFCGLVCKRGSEVIHLAIAILWLAIGIIVLGGVIYLALRAVKLFWPGFDTRIEQAVWIIFGILVLIYVLSVLAGGVSMLGVEGR